MNIESIINAASGREKADTLFINGKVINVFTGEILRQNVAVKDGYICSVIAEDVSYKNHDFENSNHCKELNHQNNLNNLNSLNQYNASEIVDLQGMYIAPGFIDPHVHIESSMVTPAQFARGVVVHGTTTVVADPHEIANVMGVKGVEYMINDSKNQPVNILFAAPSCVPATNMETSGAVLDSSIISNLLKHEKIIALAEMMNYPGVLFTDSDVMAKLKAAENSGKRADGHAPKLTGKNLNAYIASGISSDHECTTAEEALEKLRLGMYIMIREGSCAKNLDDLLPALNDNTWHQMMFCTDDRHPEEILNNGHIDHIIRKAVKAGINPVRAIQMATINCSRYFGIKDAGAVAPGRRADMVVFKDIENIVIEKVFVKGILTAQHGKINSLIEASSSEEVPKIMNLDLSKIDFSIKSKDCNAAGRESFNKIRVIKIIPDQVVTEEIVTDAAQKDGYAVSDIDRDILKIAVIERYSGKSGMAKGFVNGFGLKKGAAASTVAHDSHNIIVVGTNDNDMLSAVKTIKEMGGGFAVIFNNEVAAALPLPAAGLMSYDSIENVNLSMQKVIKEVQSLGSNLSHPFMTLGFLALPVIPKLKITDKGLVDVEKFEIVE